MDELRVADERWRAIVEQARRQLNARDLPRPAGLEGYRGGGVGYALVKSSLADGQVGCYLMFNRGSEPAVHIGSFTVTAEEIGRAPRRAAPRRRRPGEPLAGKVVRLACGREVRVEVDGLGCPMPAPADRTPLWGRFVEAE